MNLRSLLVPIALLSLLACDEKKETPPASVSAAMSATPPPPMASVPPMASAAPSAAPSASSFTSVNGAGTDDVSFTAKEPAKDNNQTVKAKTGGAFTLFLPDRDGMTWAADSVGTMGKPKEEVIPGFAPQTMGHQFKWTGLKAGKTELTFGRRKGGTKGGAPTETFKITVDAS